MALIHLIEFHFPTGGALDSSVAHCRPKLKRSLGHLNEHIGMGLIQRIKSSCECGLLLWACNLGLLNELQEGIHVHVPHGLDGGRVSEKGRFFEVLNSMRETYRQLATQEAGNLHEDELRRRRVLPLCLAVRSLQQLAPPGS